MPELARKLRIYGRVQGVSYRDWMVKAASALQVDGWVRNRHDGTVEALVVGSEPNVRELITQCQNGSAMAHVERIVEEAVQGITPRNGFVRKPSV
jgi:acylphosphatase